MIKVVGKDNNLQKTEVTVYVNDQPGKPVLVTNGTFETTVSIRPGPNTIDARAGNVRSPLIRIALQVRNSR